MKIEFADGSFKRFGAVFSVAPQQAAQIEKAFKIRRLFLRLSVLNQAGFAVGQACGTTAVLPVIPPSRREELDLPAWPSC